MTWYYQQEVKRHCSLLVLLVFTALIPLSDLLPSIPRSGHPEKEFYFQKSAHNNTFVVQRRAASGQDSVQAEQRPAIKAEPLPPLLALFFNAPFAINRADSETLQLLPGIGPRLAERIISHRIQTGFFHSSEDLTMVHGIGRKTAARLTEFLSYSE